MTNAQQPHTQQSWTGQIPDEQWQVYARVIEAARRRGLPFALGGAFSVATHTGRWRNTKDLDFYVLPEDRQAMVEEVLNTGLEDYFDTLPYDREWIFRAHQGDVIVDVIWAMANQRTQVDQAWLENGATITVRGEHLPVIPVEELIWGKLYVMQSDRCDWPDILNLVYATGPTLDWAHLLKRVGPDRPVLTGVMSLFRWLSPGRAAQLPPDLWTRLELDISPPEEGPDAAPHRAHRLDSRPWFHPLIEE